MVVVLCCVTLFFAIHICLCYLFTWDTWEYFSTRQRQKFLTFSESSSSIHPVSSIFATNVRINCMFLWEIHMGINWHRRTPDKIVIVYCSDMMYIKKVWTNFRNIFSSIWFFMVKIPHHPCIIRMCNTVKIASLIKVFVTRVCALPDHIILLSQLGA